MPDKFGFRLLPSYHFDHGVAESRGKEMGDSSPPGTAQVREQGMCGNGTGIRGDHAVLGGDVLHLREYLFLQFNIFRGSFDHPVASVQVIIINRNSQVLPHALRLLHSQLAPGHAFICVSMEPVHGARQGVPVDVDQYQLQAGNSAFQVIADIRPDSAGADDADAAGHGAGGLKQDWVVHRAISVNLTLSTLPTTVLGSCSSR